MTMQSTSRALLRLAVPVRCPSSVATTIVALVAAASIPATPAASAEYYRGKRLSMTVGFEAGGGIDIVARMLAQHMGRFIEGSPTIVVQNMPGAAGTSALNFMTQSAPKDGTTIIFDNWSPLNQVTRAQAVQYDYTKLVMIGALRSGPQMMFARKDVVAGGLTKPADISKSQGLVYAGQQPSLVLDIYGRLALDLLEVSYKYVSGYRGAPTIRLALERGEGSITTHGLQGYRSAVEPRWVKDGLFVPLWYFQRRDGGGQYVDSPLVPDIPAFLSVYKQVHGKVPTGAKWDAMELVTELYGSASNFVWGPPGMNELAITVLRKAFYSAAADSQFGADQDKAFGFRYEPVEIAKSQKIVDRLSTVTPELVAFFKEFMR